jgi:hypothetical protein
VKDVRIVFNELLPLLEDSKPDYINNFAAESFAFVARKVKDKRAFLLLVLKTLKKHSEVRTYLLPSSQISPCKCEGKHIVDISLI